MLEERSRVKTAGRKYCDWLDSSMYVKIIR